MSIVRMVLGPSLEKSEDSPVVNNCIANSERYHLDFMSYLVATLGFALVAEASNSGRATPYRSGDTVMIGCKQSAARWFWRPEPTVTLMTRNVTPNSICLERFTGPQPEMHEVLNLGGVSALMYNFGQALATNYFERNRPKIELTFGRDTSRWPGIWNFARIVRNAMSHGGAINFHNASAPAVNWKGLTYSASDNERKILHTDLWPGDIFDLVLEMDTVLSVIAGRA